MQTGKFIYTADENVKDRLVAANYQFIKRCSNGCYVFVNKDNENLTFNQKSEKVFISDTLTF